MTSKSSPPVVIESSGVQHTRALAHRLADDVRAGDILTLDGMLGAGKTTFVRFFAEALGVDLRSVSSPTYVLCHEYETKRGLALIHIDAYRLGAEDDVLELGGEELWMRPNAVWIVEWPDRIAESMPEATLRLEIEHAGPTARRFTIHGVREGFGQRFGKCPQCGKPAMRDATYAPFCSDRCRLVDLSKWFSGAHVISRPLTADDFEDSS